MIAHILGLDDASGAWYLWWSGVAGDLVYLGALGAVLRRLNCHARPCYRIGRHKVEGTSWVVCARHHSNGAPGKEQLLEVEQGFPEKPPQ